MFGLDICFTFVVSNNHRMKAIAVNNEFMSKHQAVVAAKKWVKSLKAEDQCEVDYVCTNMVKIGNALGVSTDYGDAIVVVWSSHFVLN